MMSAGNEDRTTCKSGTQEGGRVSETPPDASPNHPVRPTAALSERSVPSYPSISAASGSCIIDGLEPSSPAIERPGEASAAGSPTQVVSSRSRAHRKSVEAFGDDPFADDDGSVGAVQQAGPSSRRHSGRLVSFIDKLKPSKSVSKHHIMGDPSDAAGAATEAHPATRSPVKSGSRIASGKHTPMREEARGDFGEFLKAAELRERLEQEQIKEAEAELKAAKLKRKKGGKAHGLTAPVKAKRPASADLGPLPKRLEERKQFPGAFLDGEDEDEIGREQLLHSGMSDTQTVRMTRARGSKSSAEPASGKLARLDLCGPGDILSDSDGDHSEDEGDASPRAEPSLAAQAQSPSMTHTDSHTLLGDGLHAGKSTLTPASSHDDQLRLPRSSLSSSSSSISSTGSLADRRVAEAMVDAKAPLPARGKTASTRSLKSWRSSDSPGAYSFASGGANQKLSAPLLELEELELKSFLRNFNRHTREVRVPASVHFPRRRMPRWEDFRVPPDEAAIAAREGKRVTVLTHVDRGLQALARQEGDGAPLARRSSEGKAGRKGKSDKKKSSQGKSAQENQSSGIDEEDDGDGTVGRQPTIRWSPESGFVPYGLSTGLPDPEREEDIRFFGGGLSARGLPEKNERAAKQLEKMRRLPPPEQQASLGGKGPVNPMPSPGAYDGDEAEPVVNVHDSRTELRPRPDDVSSPDDRWEVIDKSGEVEDYVDPHEGERVDGVAFCIAYILAMVERYAPEELDNTTDQTYREGKARSHLERLYLIAPFWERLGFGIRRLYRWDNPRRTATAAMIYFILWWTDLLPTAFFLTLMFYILQFRFFPPEASYLHEQVRARMARGVEADRLAERLRRRSRLDILEIYRRFTLKYGSAVQLAAGDIADFHEKVKNLILWRNPPATWRTFTFFAVITGIVTFLPAYYIWKAGFFFLGFTFFCLLPLQSHYPRYRRPLSPIWWALWGAPTDAQFAIQLLRRRHLEKAMNKASGSKGGSGAGGGGGGTGPGGGSGGGGKKHVAKFRRSEAAHAVKGGAMRPMNEEEGTLWGLEEEVEGKAGESGEKRFKPKKLGSFFCQHRGVPGHLTVTSRSVYFRGLGQPKTCKTPLEDIAGLAKTKSLHLLVWFSPGLQIARTNKPSLFFSNVLHRDEVFNLILAVGSEVWSKV
ncbi:unnamed protein product [Parajaminaea phylloscopi]